MLILFDFQVSRFEALLWLIGECSTRDIWLCKRTVHKFVPSLFSEMTPKMMCLFIK